MNAYLKIGLIVVAIIVVIVLVLKFTGKDKPTTNFLDQYKTVSKPTTGTSSGASSNLDSGSSSSSSSSSSSGSPYCQSGGTMTLSPVQFGDAFAGKKLFTVGGKKYYCK